MDMLGMKVGQLARRTGLTVRTLHYYEEIGLLTPSRRTETGHRMYGAEDIARLQQILSLRQLGFALEDIRGCLDGPDFSLAEVLRLHLSRLREQMESQQQLLRRLESLAEHVRAAETVSVDELLQTIQVMTMYEKYYTPEQLDVLKERSREVGEERIRQVESEWAALYAEAQAEMENGTDPCDERVQALVTRSEDLISEFTGDDPGIRSSLQKMYDQEGPAKASHGMGDPATFEYMGRAKKCREVR
jgi:MerR family transcriptional regulator, thiopeptide resistance regulator